MMHDSVIDDLKQKNQQLTKENEALYNQLNEAIEIIEAIRKGAIDAVIISGNETAKVLVDTTADQIYRKFIENMSEGVVTLQTDGTIIFSNSGFAKMVNLPLEKITGKNFRDFITHEYKDDFEQFFIRYESNSSVELSFVDHSGKRKHLIVSLNMLQLHDVVALNLVCTDVTYQKTVEKNLMVVNENLTRAIEDRIFTEKKINKLNSRLQESVTILEDVNTELAAFAHIASHDLQEPLRKVITYSSMLLRDYKHNMDQRGQGFLTNMQAASQRMQNLINDILEYSRLSKAEVRYAPANLQLIVEEVLLNVEAAIEESQATITIAEALPVIEANTSQMKQLFQNIISNALKFRKPGRTPEISISYEIKMGKDTGKVPAAMMHKNFCVLKISDNGIGFSQEYNTKIFTLFQKLNNSTVYKGTGIGLAICKKIVEQHNGYISAAGKPNEGSLFTVELPVSHAVTRHNGSKVSFLSGE